MTTKHTTAATAAQASVAYLPVELYYSIANHLFHWDVYAFRLTCRRPYSLPRPPKPRAIYLHQIQ